MAKKKIGRVAFTWQFDTPQDLLLIISVARQNVVQPPRGDLLNPDVILSMPRDITVTLQDQNLPNGTPVRLRVTTSGSVLTSPNAALTNNTAIFTVTVPKGHGTLQAFVDLTLTTSP